MNKKRNLAILALLLGAAFVFWAPPAFAAEVPQDAALSPEEAAVLKQALDTLDLTLGELRARLNASSGAPDAAVESPSETKGTLGDVRGTLLAINGTLTDRELAFAARRALALQGQGEVAGAETAQEETGTVQNPALSGGAESETFAPGPATASSGWTSRQKVGLGIVIAGILGGIGYLAWEMERRRARPSVPAPQSSPEMSST